MYPRTEYEMTEEDLEKILDASKPILLSAHNLRTPVVYLSGGTPMGSNPQERANTVWSELGKKMGFDYMTVRPIYGKGQRFFSAVPSETEEQRAQRLREEAEEKRQTEILKLRDEIGERQLRLDQIQKEIRDERSDPA